MMSVASKTKTKMFTTVALGFVVVSVALPTLASTTPGFTSLSTVQPIVVSTSGQQDLSVLRAKLKERFSGVATEVSGLVGGLHGASSSQDDTSVRVLDVSQGVGSVPLFMGQNYFIDIGDDPYVSYINRLSAFGVLASSQKFYPQNYFRVDDFTALFAKLYQKTMHQAINFDTLVGIVPKDGIMTKGLLQQMMYATKNITVVSLDGEPYDKLMRSEGAYYLVRMFNLPVLSVGSASSVSAALFSDIAGHASANAVNTLASLDIVSTTAPKFYPDNYVRHYDFVVLLVNAVLAAHGQSVAVPAYSSFADVTVSASYLPQLAYASEHGFIDPLIVTKGGQFYFSPNDFVSKAQVYTILSTILPVSFVYDAQVASTQKISRGELAQLLVESFQFQAKNRATDASSLTGLGTGDLSLLTKVKVLLSLL